MTSNDVTPHKQTDHAHTWQVLIEFTLSKEPGQEQLAVSRVSKAMQILNWPAVHLEQLKLALVKATQDAMGRGHLVSAGAPLTIRVLIPEGSKAIQEGDQAGNQPSKGQVSEGATQQVDRSASRGWGFFLVQKQEDDPQASAGGSHHLIELFLYQERAIPYSADNPSHR